MNSYSDALEYLWSLRLFGTKLGLNNIKALLDLLGNPEKNLKFYHIAGTNGKGSTAAILETILRFSGEKTGLFTSPHLLDFRERIAIGGVPIAAKLLVDLIDEIKPQAEKIASKPGCAHPTYFEVVTALAALAFNRSQVSSVIWETGLGGELDATNAVSPKVAVITSIGLDHTSYLGNTLSEVARQKAGIIKAGIPTVIGKLPGEALKIMELVSARKQSPLIKAGFLFQARKIKLEAPYSTFLLDSPWDKDEEISLSLYGRHQVRNCLVALAAWWVGCDDKKIANLNTLKIKPALREVKWPGRFEILGKKNKIFIIDGAHNPSGAKILAAALEEFLQGRSLTWIFGVLADKDWGGIIHQLKHLVQRIIAVPPGGKRGLPAEELARHCRTLIPAAQVSFRKTVEAALVDCYHPSQEKDVILIAGSLRLAGAGRKILVETEGGQ